MALPVKQGPRPQDLRWRPHFLDKEGRRRGAKQYQLKYWHRPKPMEEQKLIYAVISSVLFLDGQNQYLPN
jgi:hypothetical protein